MQTDPHPQLSALLYAGYLDRLSAGTDDEVTERQLMRIGALLGGESRDGFRADVAAHLTAIEDAILDEATGTEYRAGRGGCDPEAYISDALQARIDRACDNAARAWLADAQAILAALPVAA